MNQEPLSRSRAASTRPQPRNRPRRHHARHAQTRTAPWAHFALLLMVGAIGVVAAVMFAGGDADAGNPARTAGAGAAQQVEGTAPNPAADAESLREHVTFGAHTFATMPCESCHTKGGENPPACRACHANACGAGVTTIAGCVECHATGTTDSWVPGE